MAIRPCIVRTTDGAGCPEYALTGSRCPTHETEFEAKRKTWSTGRRGTSAAWRRVRSQVLARDKACVACGAKEDLAVHHVDENSSNNALANLETRCYGCHRAAHAKVS